MQSKYFIFCYLYIDLWINHNDRIDIFSFLFPLIFFKSIKHPRRIKTTPTWTTTHPALPTTLSFILGPILPAVSPPFFPSPLSSATTISSTLLPLLRRGRFFITLGWFISRRDFLLHSISKLLYCCCSISIEQSCFHSNWKKESSQRTPFCFWTSYTIAHKREI